MRSRRLKGFLVKVGGGLALAASLFAAPAQAITAVSFATDLTDVTIGEDLWRYDYDVSAGVFPNGYGFTIFFDHAKFTGLQDPPAVVNADWDPAVLQPDTFFGDDGEYDALSVAAVNASLDDLFSLSFVWLGGSGASPADLVQPFVVYDDTFATIETGSTSPAAAPVPASWFLLIAGALPFAGRKLATYFARGQQKG